VTQGRTRVALVVLLALQAAGAIFGAIFVVPSQPVEHLKVLPDYTIPALALGLLVGGSALVGLTLPIMTLQLTFRAVSADEADEIARPYAPPGGQSVPRGRSRCPWSRGRWRSTGIFLIPSRHSLLETSDECQHARPHRSATCSWVSSASTALQHPAPGRPRPFLEPPLWARTGPDLQDLLPARVALPSRRRAESKREAPPHERHSHRLQGRSSAHRRARAPARGSGGQQPARWPWSIGGESAGPACGCHSRRASPAPWV